MPAVDAQWLLYKLILLPPLLFSLVLHEYAHARTALAFGDATAKNMGRLTLNPLAHLDPIGTLCIFLVGFGWAKPVPVNPMNLQPRKLGDIAVSVAGPASNLLIAVVTAMILRLWWSAALVSNQATFLAVHRYLLYIASVNIILCTFNLIPLFPLDGHHVVREVLPIDSQGGFMFWQMRFGSILLMALIFGPRLLAHITRNPNIPDPLGWIFTHARVIVLSALGI
ncbi:MAG: site-2 protease family protein [Phycisphaerae bacterium]